MLASLTFDALRGWAEDDHAAAFRAWRYSAQRMLDVPYAQRKLSVDTPSMLVAAQEGIALGTPDRRTARDFFERAFRPYLVEEPGFLTGYFEPVLQARRTRRPGFEVPLLARPDDLVEVDDTNAPEGWPEGMRFGRQTANGILEHPDRASIMAGELDGAGLEIAWLSDPVDAFFVHVQGAARLETPEGPMRVTYDGKSGHPYTSLGRVLCKRLGVPPETMTADVLANWMRANSTELSHLLAQNRSYIFFRETASECHGPIAAAKVPLSQGRSLAVDRLLHTFGTPVWIETDTPLPDRTEPLSRLMVAQDTGSAIVGPARSDIYMGSGQKCGHVAGRVRHPMRMVVLLPVAS